MIDNFLYMLAKPKNFWLGMFFRIFEEDEFN